MVKSPSADLSTYAPYGGEINLLQWCSGVTAKPPADFIGHPVSYPGKNRLVEEKSLQRCAIAAGSQLPQVGESKHLV